MTVLIAHPERSSAPAASGTRNKRIAASKAQSGRILATYHRNGREVVARRHWTGANRALRFLD
jgi:hypothetical protein